MAAGGGTWTKAGAGDAKGSRQFVSAYEIFQVAKKVGKNTTETRLAIHAAQDQQVLDTVQSVKAQSAAKKAAAAEAKVSIAKGEKAPDSAITKVNQTTNGLRSVMFSNGKYGVVNDANEILGVYDRPIHAKQRLQKLTGTTPAPKQKAPAKPSTQQIESPKATTADVQVSAPPPTAPSAIAAPKTVASDTQERLTLSDGTSYDLPGGTAVVSKTDAAAKAQYAGWSSSLTTTERSVITDVYQTTKYRAVNAYLRKPGVNLANDPFVTKNGTQSFTEPQVKGWIGQLDSALAKSSTPDNLLTYRGQIRGSTVDKAIKSMNVGDTFRDEAYVSTSLDAKYARTFATAEPNVPGKGGGPGTLMKIVARKGTKVAYLPTANGYQAEYEMLFARGTSFRLISKQTESSGLTVAVLEVID